MILILIFRRVSLVLLMVLPLFGSSNVFASPGTPEKLDYLTWTTKSPQDDDLVAYWRDQVSWIEWHSPRPVTIYRRYFFNADGRRLFVTMLSAAGGVCGIRECPVRIFDEFSRKILELSACDDAEQHEISADRLFFVACGVKHAIPQAGPVGSFETTDVRQLSHNGSIVVASFYKNGRVRIEYDEVRKGLPPSLRGELLFQGTADRNGNLDGTAYTFKDGCTPAPYAVRGRFDKKGNLTLSGEAPMRDTGCDVVRFSTSSANARLVFVDIGWDQ